MPINQSVEVRVIARMKAGWKLVCDLYFLKFVLGLSLKERKDMIFFFFFFEFVWFRWENSNRI